MCRGYIYFFLSMQSNKRIACIILERDIFCFKDKEIRILVCNDSSYVMHAK